jgi:hypothetical protein
MLLFGCLGVESPTCRRLNYLNEIEVGGEVKKGNKIQRSPPTRKFPARVVFRKPAVAQKRHLLGTLRYHHLINRVVLKRQFAAFYSLVVCDFFRQTETP